MKKERRISILKELIEDNKKELETMRAMLAVNIHNLDVIAAQEEYINVLYKEYWKLTH